MSIQNATAISILPADVRAATATGLPVDVLNYDGSAVLVLDAEAQGSGITNTVKLQASPDLAAGANYLPAVAGTNNIALRHGAADNVKLAAKLTQSGARQLKEVVLVLKRAGTIASGDVWVTIEAESTGAPSGTPLGTSVKVAAATITDAYGGIKFTFATPVELADATAYYVVLQGDYTASATNQIQWRTATVASGGNSFVYDSSWAAVATNSHEYLINQYNFADTGTAFTAVGNAVSTQSLVVNLSELHANLRAVATVAGGSSVGAVSVLLLAIPRVS